MSCRSEIELLCLLLDQYKHSVNIGLYSGLCVDISLMSLCGHINQIEEHLLKSIILKHRPQQIIEGDYWWLVEDTESRINFLQKLIEEYDI